MSFERVDRVGCTAMVWRRRGLHLNCVNRAAEGKGYCKIHDPVAVQKRRDDSQRKYDAEVKHCEAIKVEGESLVCRLKVQGSPHYHWKDGWQHSIVIPFDEAEKLIQRLADVEQS